MMLLGWECIWQKSAKFDGGNLSLGMGNPHPLYETLYTHLFWLSALSPSGVHLDTNFPACNVEKLGVGLIDEVPIQ